MNQLSPLLFYFIVNSAKELLELDVSTEWFFLILTINTKFFVVNYLPCFHKIIMSFSITMCHTLFCDK